MKYSEEKIKFFELVIEAFRAIAWPVVVLVIVFSMFAPLKKTIELVPELLSQSTKITIAGVSVELNQRLSDQVSPRLKRALENLSPEAIRIMISSRKSMVFGTAEDAKNPALFELEKAGLITIKLDELGQAYWQPTRYGEETIDFLADFTVELFTALNRVAGGI